MRHITASIFLLVTLLSQLSFASDDIVVGKGSSTLILKSKTATECIVTTIEKYRRQFIFLLNNDKSNYYLITQDFEIGEGCFEGNDPANVIVTAKEIDVISGRVSDKTVWTFSTKGISGIRTAYPLEGLYAVTYPGCCGGSNSTKYFSLYSGKLIGASAIKPLVVEIPNTRKIRYISAQDETASDYKGKKSGTVTFFYSDNEKIRQELLITIPKAHTESCYLTNLRFVGKKESDESYSLWDKSTFERFAVSSRLLCERTGEIIIEIPVIADMLSPTKAIVKGIPTAKIEDVSHNQ